MESKLCGSYHFGKQTLWVVGCRRKPTWVDGLTLEVKSKLCRWSHHRGFHVSRKPDMHIYQRGFYIIWKANFVGRITVEVVFYLNYPTLWKSITVEVVLYLNYPTLRKMLAKSAANFAKKSQKFVKIFRSDKSKIANGM